MTEETTRTPINREQFEHFVNLWLDYARDHLTDIRLQSHSLLAIKRRAIEAGVADEDSVALGEAVVKQISEQQVEEEQKDLLEINQRRLSILCRLLGKKPKDLAETTVVSIGGGPGDGICEPWFPRIASITGANVVNFDYSDAHPIDQNLGLYKHVGGEAGNVFRLLLNDVTLASDLKDEQNIAIIECNNLIGNNVSPALGLELGTMTNINNHPKVIEMRKNLLMIAEQILIDGGVLAIDDAYWVKRNGKLFPVDEVGHPRIIAIFDEEKF